MTDKQALNKKDFLPLSVIIPVYNEEKIISRVLSDIKLVLSDITHEVVLVDDGSKDQTVEVAKSIMSENQKIIVLEGNYGQSAAILAGLENSKNDVIAIMDGDGQIDPYDIERMYKLLIDGGHQLIQGVRSKRSDPSFKTVTSKYANKIIRQVLGTDIQDAGCSAKVFRRSVLNEFAYFDGFHRLFSVIAQKKGIPVRQVAVNHRPRKHGTSNYGLGRIFKVLRHILGLSFKATAMQESMTYMVRNIAQGTRNE